MTIILRTGRIIAKTKITMTINTTNINKSHSAVELLSTYRSLQAQGEALKELFKRITSIKDEFNTSKTNVKMIQIEIRNWAEQTKDLSREHISKEEKKRFNKLIKTIKEPLTACSDYKEIVLEFLSLFDGVLRRLANKLRKVNIEQLKRKNSVNENASLINKQPESICIEFKDRKLKLGNKESKQIARSSIQLFILVKLFELATNKKITEEDLLEYVTEKLTEKPESESAIYDGVRLLNKKAKEELNINELIKSDGAVYWLDPELRNMNLTQSESS